METSDSGEPQIGGAVACAAAGRPATVARSRLTVVKLPVGLSLAWQHTWPRAQPSVAVGKPTHGEKRFGPFLCEF